MADVESNNEQAQQEEQAVYRRARKIYWGFFIGAIVLISLSILTMMPFGFLAAFGTSLWAINFSLTLTGIGCLLGAGITFITTRTRRLMKKASKNTEIIQEGSKNSRNFDGRALNRKRNITAKIIDKFRKRHPNVANWYDGRINPKTNETNLGGEEPKPKDEQESIDNVCKALNTEWIDHNSRSSEYEKDNQVGCIGNITLKNKEGAEYTIPIDYETQNSYEVPLILLNIKKRLNNVEGISEVTFRYNTNGEKDADNKYSMEEKTYKKEEGKALFSTEDLKKNKENLNVYKKVDEKTL